MRDITSKYQWILFDADNTLFDFDRASYDALHDLIIKVGMDFFDDLYHIYHQINIEVWGLFEEKKIDSSLLRTLRFKRFFDHLNWEVDTVECSIYYLERLVFHTKIYTTTMDLLDAIKDRHKLAIITNGLREVQRPRIENLGLTAYFETIVVSDEIGYSKPNREYFEYAHNQMGNPEKSSVLVVGDSLRSDIAGGHNFEFDTCWYNPAKKENDSKLIPTHEISSHGELVDLLKY